MIIKATTNILDPKKLQSSLKSQNKPLLIGTMKEKSNVLELKENIGDISIQNLSPSLRMKQQSKIQEEKSATVEFQHRDKKKIWKDKLNISEANIQITKLSKTLDLVLTSKEMALTPFWTQQSKEISQKLWLPTKTDSVDLVLISSKELSQNTPMGQSWFSIKKKHPHKKNSLMTSFQSSQFSLPDCMDLGATVLNKKSPPLKTIKIRLFPTETEKKNIHLMFDQFRWYYNSTITMFYNYYGKDNILNKSKYSNYTIRDKIVRKHKYTEEIAGNLLFKDFVYDESLNEDPVPLWWKDKVHSRISRGAISKFTSSINSAISNFKNGNISKFDMKYMSKKKPTEYLHFEDKQYPSFIRKIKSKYSYTTKDRKRVNMSFADIDTQKRGIEIIYEKNTDKYYLHYPVERSWFPSNDKRNDSQIKFSSLGDRIISLDPGIRKFLTGYNPTGESIIIGEGASLELTALLLENDKNPSVILRRKIKNLVEELHWKTITYLIENYDTIILPDFRVSQMIRSKKLNRMVKRLMCQFSFFQFKEKLKFKCSWYNKKLIIVDESYTSCTCTSCGFIMDTKGKENLNCPSCNLDIDRDIAGSRNIFIKNTRLRFP